MEEIYVWGHGKEEGFDTWVPKGVEVKFYTAERENLSKLAGHFAELGFDLQPVDVVGEFVNFPSLSLKRLSALEYEFRKTWTHRGEVQVRAFNHFFIGYGNFSGTSFCTTPKKCNALRSGKFATGYHHDNCEGLFALHGYHPEKKPSGVKVFHILACRGTDDYQPSLGTTIMQGGELEDLSTWFRDVRTDLARILTGAAGRPLAAYMEYLDYPSNIRGLCEEANLNLAAWSYIMSQVRADNWSGNEVEKIRTRALRKLGLKEIPDQVLEALPPEAVSLLSGRLLSQQSAVRDLPTDFRSCWNDATSREAFIRWLFFDASNKRREVSAEKATLEMYRRLSALQGETKTWQDPVGVLDHLQGCLEKNRFGIPLVEASWAKELESIKSLAELKSLAVDVAESRGEEHINPLQRRRAMATGKATKSAAMRQVLIDHLRGFHAALMKECEQKMNVAYGRYEQGGS